MLLLSETAAGIGLFSLKNKSLLEADADDVAQAFSDPGTAADAVSLDSFSKFKDTKAAMEVATDLLDSKVPKALKKMLKKHILDKGLKDQLAVREKGLAAAITKKLGIECVYTPATQELFRGINTHFHSLVEGLSQEDSQQMSLGLAHCLSRFKLKFSADKVDTMIIQAIGLLDDIDKELNNFAMRLREWYGWHFPEIAKIVTDNAVYARVVKKMGMRTSAKSTDFEGVVPEEIAAEIKKAAEISMGTDITADDMANIHELCDSVITLGDNRASLAEYLKQRMAALAPNLTHMVGELVGARLISHAGSLMSLAKHPSSTVQILGAEKALFRALKQKKNTPKYGLIYHASLVGQAQPKTKGKIARVLAAKLALCSRVDALSEGTAVSIGEDCKEYVEKRLMSAESGTPFKATKTSKQTKVEKYMPPQAATKSGTDNYNVDADVVDDGSDAEGMELVKKKKKDKKEKKRKAEEAEAAEDAAAEEPAKKKKKKAKAEDDA